MPSDRSIEMEVEVTGTPEEVWRAIATGPGITSWYVPHDVEEQAGGAMSASFGPGMEVAGRVAEWDPPRRVVFDGGEGVEAMAFEWTVEARAGGTCVVRLVNAGFGSGEDWDDHFDAMTEGWQIFLFNLELHLEHFGGQAATPILALATWLGPRDEAWARLTTDLDIGRAPAKGERVEIETAEGAVLSGAVADAARSRISLLVDQPCPGTAFLAVEGRGEEVEVSIWSYLYGPEGAAAAEQYAPLWQAWLDVRAK